MRDQALRTNTTVDRGQEIREGTENNPVWQGANYLLSLDTFLPKEAPPRPEARAQWAHLRAAVQDL